MAPHVKRSIHLFISEYIRQNGYDQHKLVRGVRKEFGFDAKGADYVIQNLWNEYEVRLIRFKFEPSSPSESGPNLTQNGIGLFLSLSL